MDWMDAFAIAALFLGSLALGMALKALLAQRAAEDLVRMCDGQTDAMLRRLDETRSTLK